MAAWRAIVVGLVVFGTCVVPNASGEDGGRAPAQSGLRVWIDPQTGRFVPAPSGRPPAESRPLRPPLAARLLPNGETEIELDERYRSKVVATVGADGRVHLGCVTGDGPHVHAGE